MITKSFKVDKIFTLNKNHSILDNEKLLEGYYIITNNSSTEGITKTEYIFVGIFSNEENLALFNLKYNLIERN